MPEFQVVCKDRDGNTIEETRTGASRDRVMGKLRDEGYVPISIKRTGQTRDADDDEVEDSGLFSLTLRRKVKLDQLAVAFRTLATMLGGGLPIISTLEEVGLQADNPYFRSVLLSMAHEVREGSTLSESMAQRPDVFPPIARSMVHAGEESGNLARLLNDLSDYLEAQQELRRKVRAGTRYPLFVAGFFMVALSVIVIFVIPKFQEIYSQFNVDLPLLTRIVTGVSTTIGESLIFIIPALILLAILFHLWKKTEQGRRLIDYAKLKIPLIGNLAHQLIIARFSRSLSLLLDSGIPVVQALALSSEIADNVPVRDEIEDVREKIVRGSSLSKELDKHRYFPRMLTKMTAAGEASGQLGTMLERVADHFDREATSQIEGLLSLLEPVILVLLGVTVGIVVVAVYLPIFNLARTMG
ncbi:MAG: type II secretion system F family protein [Planctomycetota bacterium]